MATISKVGVIDGQIVYAIHVKRIVDALDGTASNTIIINADLKQGSLANITNGLNSHAEGDTTTASGQHSHSEGRNTTAQGNYSHAEGRDTSAQGVYSHAEGQQTTSQGNYSHAEGERTLAVGNHSHASGLETIAYANNQTAVGRYNLDLNSDDYFVVGDGTNTGNRSNALGVNATRTYMSNSILLPDLNSGSNIGFVLTYDTSSKQVYFTSSRAFGGIPNPPNKAIQFNSASQFSGSIDFIFDYTKNSFGHGSQVTASGNYSHAHGDRAVAIGNYSYAHGLLATASGIASTALGWMVSAPTNYQTAIGQFNKDNNTSDYFVVGVGLNTSNKKDGLGVNNTRTYISSSLLLPDITDTSQTYVLTYNTASKEVSYRTGSAFGGGGGGIPGGPDKSIQFNKSTAFSGSSIFTFDYNTNKVLLTGSLTVTGSVSSSKTLISSSGNEQLKIIGSGSSNPMVGTYGSQGNLLEVTDSLSGSLLSVNNISGFPMFEVFSDKTVLLGDPISPAYHSSTIRLPAATTFTLGLVPTSSYDGVFYEYVVKSGSDARSGYINSVWAGTTIKSSSLVTSDIGNTSGIVLYATLSGSYVVLTGSAAAANWTIKSIVRAI